MNVWIYSGKPCDCHRKMNIFSRTNFKYGKLMSQTYSLCPNGTKRIEAEKCVRDLYRVNGYAQQNKFDRDVKKHYCTNVRDTCNKAWVFELLNFAYRFQCNYWLYLQTQNTDWYQFSIKLYINKCHACIQIVFLTQLVKLIGKEVSYICR